MKRSVIIFWFYSFLNIALGQSSSFNTEDIKLINQLKLNHEVKARSIDSLYNSYGNSFNKILILDHLISNGKINQFANRQNDTYLQFARIINKRAALDFIKDTKSLGTKIFLEGWYIFQHVNDTIIEEFKDNRCFLLFQEHKRIISEINNSSFENKIQILFNKLDKWDTPFDFESSIIIIKDIFNKSNISQKKIIIQNLISYYKSNIPSSLPPPYTIKHTNFYIANLLAKSIADVEIIEFLNTLKKSENVYITKEVTETIKWINSKTQYPIEYQTLFVLYNSQQ